MAFLDSLDRKVTNFGQGAIKKTKDVSEVTRIQGQIRYLEGQKKEVILELGQLLYLKYTDCLDEVDVHLVEKIKELDERILGYKKTVNKIKGIIFCPICNAENSQESKFCSSCGGQIIIKDSEQPQIQEGCICPSCGSMNEQGSKFCSYCGNKIECDEVQENSAEQVIVCTKMCSKCGNELDSDAEFCMNCGQKVNG